MLDYRAYAFQVEERLLDYIFKSYYLPLRNSLEQYRGAISFVTDKEPITRGGRLLTQELIEECKKKGVVIAYQRRLLTRFIEEVNKFGSGVISEDSQQKIFGAAITLKDEAIRLGYCEEASGLLKIIKNPKLVGSEFSMQNVKKDLLRVLENYGKRQILVEKESYLDKVESVIGDTCNGLYGEELIQGLSIHEMKAAYEGATVTRGNFVYKMDGTVSPVEKKKA